MAKHLLIRLAIFAMGTLAFSGAARAQTFDVDFARASDEPPLVKTKFGVYQTPLVTLPRLLDSIPLLREAGVRDLRYETGWGKPDVLAFDQIGGTPANLTTDFSMLDAFVGALQRANVRPLLALTYNPTPLQTRTQWARWKDMPSDLNAWREINRAYAAHLQMMGARASYEVWNEPDMPEPNGKMFFSGNADDYGRLYAQSVLGIKRGDAVAAVGGPAAAYDLNYLKPILNQPLDFASIHGYDNYAGQIAGMRGVLKDRPDVPIWLTEYASFSDLPANGPQSRHAGAMRFFRDAKGLLALTDVTRVYWAQWLDAGDAPGMGLITFDGHRKAIYNAFKIYAMMPVDRNFVGTVAGTADARELDAMASSDAHRASVVVWNTSDQAQTATINLSGLPFQNGVLQTFRIDATHASYVDNPASETLTPTQTTPFRGAHNQMWRGEVPANSVVYLQASDAATPPLSTSVTPTKIGDWVRTTHWFPDRAAGNTADFDARSGIVRLGSGGATQSQIGVLIDNPARQLKIRVEQTNVPDTGALCGLRLDFAARDGKYSRSVFVHNQNEAAARAAILPWGKGGKADAFIAQTDINNGREFVLDLTRLAPPNWNGHRVMLSFVLSSAAHGARTKWMIEP